MQFYNGWKGTTVISAGIAAAMVFVGHMLGWPPEKIDGMSKTLVELVGTVLAAGVAGKVSGAIAAKKNGADGTATTGG